MLSAVLRADPNNPLVLRHLGIALMRQRKYAEKGRVLNALIADGDSSTEKTLALWPTPRSNRESCATHGRALSICCLSPVIPTTPPC